MDGTKKFLKAIWQRGAQNTLSDTALVGSGIAISVFIGLYLGLVIQQTSGVGQAIVTIHVNNATDFVKVFVSQATQDTNSFPVQTLWYAILLILLVFVPKIGYRHPSSIVTSIGFPILITIAFITMPIGTIPASLPQTIVHICLASTAVDTSVNQIYDYVIFYQSFVFAVQTLLIITAYWVSARLFGISRNRPLNGALLVIPVLVTIFANHLIPIPLLVIGPTPTCTGFTPVEPGGSIQVGGIVPAYLTMLSSTLIYVAFVAWATAIAISAQDVFHRVPPKTE